MSHLISLKRKNSKRTQAGICTRKVQSNPRVAASNRKERRPKDKTASASAKTKKNEQPNQTETNPQRPHHYPEPPRPTNKRAICIRPSRIRIVQSIPNPIPIPIPFHSSETILLQQPNTNLKH
jgi:hypothetical protein